MSLFDSLDLASAESDPNHIAPGVWVPGTIDKSELVKPRSKTEISHVITYKVVSGEFEGKTQAEWFKLGVPHYDDAGNLVKIEFTMSEQAKSFYKMRLENLGVPESKMNSLKPEDLIGFDVNFQVKKNGQYQNVAAVELRTEPVNEVSPDSDDNSEGSDSDDTSALGDL